MAERHPSVTADFCNKIGKMQTSITGNWPPFRAASLTSSLHFALERHNIG